MSKTYNLKMDALNEMEELEIMLAELASGEAEAEDFKLEAHEMQYRLDALAEEIEILEEEEREERYTESAYDLRDELLTGYQSRGLNMKDYY